MSISRIFKKSFHSSSLFFPSKVPLAKRSPALFVRQPLSQTDAVEQVKIQEFIDWLKVKPVHLLLGEKAMSDNEFRPSFETLTGLDFTPENFRKFRLDLLRQKTDGYVFYWGKGLSVSGGFEAGFLYALHELGIQHMPMFFAEASPIKTSLVRKLPNATYASFNKLAELEAPFNQFLKRIESNIENEKMSENRLGMK